ncbi:uncharacterized protein LOC118179399, partial [Stegodyphus dumicola]|uniref:uncharacterized protein LOC118179399 n=1 Tax=Stegodyphus dumicola TaxID=202533 RepID=UPI0015B0D4AD
MKEEIKEGSMRAGDRLLLVNGVNISWLSLMEVAKILNEKEEAVLLIEYNVGNVNLLKQPTGEVELEIEALYSKLGVSLASSVTNPSKICIDQIQRGSIAERCGAFHVGDIILSVNGTDIASLTETKVNALIQRLRKHPGKMLYFPVEESSRQWNENIPSGESINISSDACKNLSAEENILHPSRCSGVCSNISVAQRSADQSKTTSFISLLHDGVKTLKTIKSSLSQLAIKTANNREIACESRACGIEPELCLHLESELLNLNSLCARTFHNFRDMVLQLVTHSSCCNDNFSFKIDLIKHRCLRHEVINTLKDNLADILENKAISKQSFDIQMRGLSEVDLNCHKCSETVLFIFAVVQKILLVLSLKDESSYIWKIIKVLVCSLNEHKIPCEVCSNRQYSLVSVSEGNGSIEGDYHNATFHPRRLGPENPRRQSSIPGKEFNALVQEISAEVQCMPSVDINLKDKRAHFYTSELQKETNTLRNCIGETNGKMFPSKTTKVRPANHNSPTEKLTVSNSEPSHPYEDSSHINANSKNYAVQQEKKLQEDKGFVALPETDIEPTNTDFLLKTKFPQNKLLSRCNTSTIAKNDSGRNSSDIKSNPQVSASQGSSPSAPILTKENWRSNDNVFLEVSTRESRRHPEVLDVKLINRGEGFGFTIGYTKSRYVPVITAVKEKSPVH